MLDWLLRRLLGTRATPHENRRKQHSRGESAATTDSDGDGFRFSPELFEMRTDVIVELSDRGFEWLSDYSSVDPVHDLYGIEVCGIHNKDDAAAILDILREMFPDWQPGGLSLKDYGREPGFKARVHRDNDRSFEHWDTA